MCIILAWLLLSSLTCSLYDRACIIVLFQSVVSFDEQRNRYVRG